MAFKEIPIEGLSLNPFTKIGQEWALLSAGVEGKYNTMTVAWASLGVMWHKNTVNIYIRPQRYTLEFVDNNDYFTLSFFDEKYRKGLNICGVKSGRDGDKVSEAGFTPYFVYGTTAFEEANMILICKKKYRQELKEEFFLDQEMMKKNYPEKDYHVMYFGEIEHVLVREE